MNENKSLLVRSSATFGLFMGIYWMIKYIFFILGLSSEMMNTIYWGLTLAVPMIAYRFTQRYRLMIGGKIGFFHAWQFGVLLYFFAALIVSLIHYIFYRYIAPPDLLSTAMNQTIELLKQSNATEEMVESISNVRLTPIQMAIQGILNNVFYGVLFSLPVALIVSLWKRDRNIPTITPTDSNE